MARTTDASKGFAIARNALFYILVAVILVVVFFAVVIAIKVPGQGFVEKISYIISSIMSFKKP